MADQNLIQTLCPIFDKFNALPGGDNIRKPVRRRDIIMNLLDRFRIIHNENCIATANISARCRVYLNRLMPDGMSRRLKYAHARHDLRLAFYQLHLDSLKWAGNAKLRRLV